MTSYQNNEAATVEAACRGDKTALATLYQRYYPVMVWVAYSVLLDRSLAEDAAQQAFAGACQRIQALKHFDRFGPWLTRICRNTARDMARVRRRDALLQKAVAADSSARARSDGFDVAVKEAVDNLSPMYRELVVLHYYNGMSYKEIETVLAISSDRIKGRLARARKQIRKRLEKDGFRQEQ